MTTATRPVITFTKGSKGVSVRCTACGRTSRWLSEADARWVGQAHSDFHFDRGEHCTVELGGLL